MENYSFLRELADSWGLLVLFTFFVGMVLWVLRPGSRAARRRVGKKNGDAPSRILAVGLGGGAFICHS